MKIIEISLEGISRISISFNWILVLVLLALIFTASHFLPWVCRKWNLKSVQIDEATIGIGSSSVTVKYDGRIKEIAYKIWIELKTRKIGIMYDTDYDVLVEVYSSWYEAFKEIRLLLETVPAERIKEAEGLIRVTTDVLNEGLRPHLTKWQARFRRWYDEEVKKEENAALSPQEIQLKFPEYESLIEEVKATNTIMIKYAEMLKRIIDGKQ